MTLYVNRTKFSDRQDEARRILSKYPNRIPIIIEKNTRCKDIPDISKKKYLARYNFASVINVVFLLGIFLSLNSTFLAIFLR